MVAENARLMRAIPTCARATGARPVKHTSASPRPALTPGTGRAEAGRVQAAMLRTWATHPMADKAADRAGSRGGSAARDRMALRT